MSDNLIRGIQTVMFLLIVLQVSAQQESFLLSGRVLDAKSKQPVSIASLQNGRELILTNVKGEFQINVKPGDHLMISHTAYQPAFYVVGTDMGTPLEILLEEKVVELLEVEVSSVMSEESFKNEVLLTVPKHSHENKLAIRNLQMIKQIVPLGYSYDFNSYDVLFRNAKSLNEISFFSTNPSVGLFKAWRQIGQGGLNLPFTRRSFQRNR